MICPTTPFFSIGLFFFQQGEIFLSFFQRFLDTKKKVIRDTHNRYHTINSTSADPGVYLLYQHRKKKRDDEKHGINIDTVYLVFLVCIYCTWSLVPGIHILIAYTCYINPNPVILFFVRTWEGLLLLLLLLLWCGVVSSSLPMNGTITKAVDVDGVLSTNCVRVPQQS